MLIKLGGMGHVMRHNYSSQNFPSMSLVPLPLVLSKDATGTVNWLQQEKMSPQPFKEGTGGNRVKGAIWPSDIWGETAIYVRSCWKKDRRSRHITLQPFIGWTHTLTWTANTVAQQQRFLFIYVCVCMCVCVCQWPTHFRLTRVYTHRWMQHCSECAHSDFL